MLTATQVGVGLAALFVFLINIYLDFILLVGATGKLSASILGTYFFLRHVLILVASYPIGRWGHIGNWGFILWFIIPSLLSFHGLYISQSAGMLELWPPFLLLDLVLYTPAFILHAVVSKKPKVPGSN